MSEEWINLLSKADVTSAMSAAFQSFLRPQEIINRYEAMRIDNIIEMSVFDQRSRQTELPGTLVCRPGLDCKPERERNANGSS